MALNGLAAPVFKFQVWDHTKVGDVAGKQGCRMRKGNGSDFQVHLADFQTEGFQSLIFYRGALVEIERGRAAIIVKVAVETSIDIYLSGN